MISGTPPLITNGLVFYIDAFNKSSYAGNGTTWNDLSGNNTTSTLTNGPTFSNDSGGSIVFDGNNDYAILSSSNFQSGNNSFSMGCWFKWNGNGTNAQNIMFGYGNDATGNNKCSLIAVVSNLFHFEFGGATGKVTSTTTIATGSWYYGFMTYDGNYTRAYLNGKLENTTAYSSANVQLSGYNGVTAGIGCLFSQYGNVLSGIIRYGTFNGNIAVIKYYNRTLSNSEILQNYNAYKGRFGLS